MEVDFFGEFFSQGQQVKNRTFYNSSVMYTNEHIHLLANRDVARQ